MAKVTDYYNSIALHSPIIIKDGTQGQGKFLMSNTGGTSTWTYLSGFGLTITGGTVSGDTVIFVNDTGGTFDVTGFYTGTPITLNVIPQGTGLNITDGTWGFSGNTLYSLNTGGAIGIGTSIPATPLDIQFYNNSQGSAIAINNTSGGVNAFTGIEYKNDSNKIAWAYLTSSGYNTYGPIQPNQLVIDVLADNGFTVGTDLGPITFAAGSYAESMKLYISGNVSIGQAGDVAKLAVKTAPNSYGIYHTDGTVGLSTYIASTNAQLGTTSNHPFALFTNNANTNLFLDTNGNVGIMNTTPSARLHLTSISDGIGTFGLKVDALSSNPNLYVRDDGYVGIGIAAPSAQLHVLDNGSETGIISESLVPSSSGSITLKNNLGTTTGLHTLGGSFPTNFTTTELLYFDSTVLLSDSSAGLAIVNYNPSGFIRFATSGYSGIPDCERMRIDQYGNVGIGTRTPTSRLHIQGADTATTYGLKVDNSNTSPIFYVRDDNRIIYTDGNQGLGKHLISDTDGIATWQSFYDITVTGGTFSAGTATYTNNTGGTFNVTGFSENGWGVAGNTGLVDNVNNFLGNTDDVPINFIINGQNAGRIDGSTYNPGNTLLGYQTMGSVNFGYPVGRYSVAIGYQAQYAAQNPAGSTAIGYQSLYENQYGYYNIGVGNSSLLNTNGYQTYYGWGNVGVGRNAAYANTTGSLNVAIGNATMYSNITGDLNTVVGANSDVGSAGLTNATAIGGGAIVYSSNTVTIGNSSVTAFTFNGAFMPYYSSAYQAGDNGSVLVSQGSGVAPQWTTGYTGTITTAKLTTGGTQGSMTFTNGLLTSQTQAT